MPLDRFLKTSFTAGPGQTRRVEVLNAPADAVLTIHTPNGAQQVVVPADGIVIVPASRCIRHPPAIGSAIRLFR